MAALKIGFIGVGGIASFYADGLKKIPDAEIWSICDSSPEPLERRRVEWGCRQRACTRSPRRCCAIPSWTRS